MRPDLLPRGFIGKLDHVQEECAEVIKAISKLRRFGYEATDPQTNITYNNVTDVRDEMRDAIGAMVRLDRCFEHELPDYISFPMGSFDPATQNTMQTIAGLMAALDVHTSP